MPDEVEPRHARFLRHKLSAISSQLSADLVADCHGLTAASADLTIDVDQTSADIKQVLRGQ
jgi:hypothetical protein